MSTVWIVTQPGYDGASIDGVFASIEAVKRAFPKGKWQANPTYPECWETTDGRATYREAEKYEVLA